MNASAIFGRIILGQLGDALGRFNVMIFTLILATIAPLAIWTTSHAAGELIAFAIVFGFTAAAYMSLAPACSAQLTSNPSYIGARVGILMTAMAPGILTGPSIGGALISATKGSYIGLQCFVGGTIALGTVFAIAGRFAARPCIRAKF
ncbi:uncharacterized protein STEHIDRAFT_157884 [Stereum hirsutum FP-91666 SS1]|uniref:uncharacterized protein n=1 Tax=Stereum hirsutum (strain FP-91666) TaxID=721885 RepID=UPI0004449D32|nr:uncharacterized protein STEHIDRAFT_157884 [Stereum hirsutum FP-91666 SS1]EIM85244.1 hypothetical protein STEHIDRAFT_157884 [Stereum hirsutum FP-91666 SS1]